jgi:hypothetical protein
MGLTLLRVAAILTRRNINLDGSDPAAAILTWMALTLLQEY